MDKITNEAIRPCGDLYKRADRGFDRLETDIYQAAFIRKQEKETDWPGDWGGRTLLAVSLLSMAMDRKSVYADGIFEELFGLRNERGYLGNIEADTIFDEQQFSGHNWLLRGLLNYYKWRKDPRALAFAEDIVNHLYLPATGYYMTYPVNPDDHVYAGGKSGSVTGQVVHHWRTSSDTGCAFMCLDGLADYYALTKREDVKRLLEEMIAIFTSIDFVGLSMQTHASLSATRGVIKMYRQTNNEAYLAFAEKLFALYLDYGATINYANYNWFRRAAWTEPCAIIDSYILCVDLFCATEKSAYLQVANRIRYNAMEFAQRYNGGFGCDICVGPKEVVLRADAEPGGDPICEAFWCCTMRGGEGLSAVVGNAYLRQDDKIVLGQYGDSVLKMDEICIQQKTTFPYEGNITLKIDRKNDAIKRIALYVPEYAENVRLLQNGVAVDTAVVNGFVSLDLVNASQTVELLFDISLKREKCIGKMTLPGAYSFWHGDLMMGVEKAGGLTLTDMQILHTEKGYSLPGGQRLMDLRGNIDLSPNSASQVKAIQVAFC